MVFANLDHRGKNVIPGLLPHQRFIREQAAIPADMLRLLRDLAFLIAQPGARIAAYIQLAVGIGGKAVLAGLVM